MDEIGIMEPKNLRFELKLLHETCFFLLFRDNFNTLIDCRGCRHNVSLIRGGRHSRYGGTDLLLLDRSRVVLNDYEIYPSE